MKIDPAIDDPGQSARFFILKSQERLRAVAQLQDNWDACGSRAPRREAIANASARLPELFRAVSSVGGWKDPHVSASENGDITFDWWSQHRKVTLYIGDVQLEVVKSWGSNIRHEMDVLDLPYPADFATIWEWLNDGR